MIVRNNTMLNFKVGPLVAGFAGKSTKRKLLTITVLSSVKGWYFDSHYQRYAVHSDSFSDQRMECKTGCVLGMFLAACTVIYLKEHANGSHLVVFCCSYRYRWILPITFRVTSRPRVGVTKPISSVALFSEIFKTHISYWISRLYLTGVAAAQLRWHLSNINVIRII